MAGAGSADSQAVVPITRSATASASHSHGSPGVLTVGLHCTGDVMGRRAISNDTARDAAGGSYGRNSGPVPLDELRENLPGCPHAVLGERLEANERGFRSNENMRPPVDTE
jgi:hypothetical protein